jgi:hypothetical protein
MQKAIEHVDSKPELRAFVVMTFKRVGASGLGTDVIFDKITNVLHKHYSLLYKQLTGQEKVLADAPIVETDAELAEEQEAPSNEGDETEEYEEEDDGGIENEEQVTASEGIPPTEVAGA